MIEDKRFREIEGMLYKYYNNIRLKYRLENKAYRLEKERDSVLKDIKNTNITLEDGLKAISYNEKIKTSNKSSIQGNVLEKEIIKLEREFKSIISKYLKLKARIREIKRMINDIEDMLVDLTDEENRILELKFSGKRTNVYIAKQLNIDESTVRRKRREIIERIAKQIAA